MPAKIFVNYRRSDSDTHAKLIASHLKSKFGARNVFIDENLSGGQVFPMVLEQRLGQCGVMVSIIGATWLEAKADDGSRRLDSETDWVRLEIARALARKIPVVPVLLNGTPLPARGKLPDDIARLIDHHAVNVRTEGPGTAGDMQVLVQDIAALIGGWPKWLIGAAAAVLLAAGGAGAYWAGVPFPQFPKADPAAAEQAAIRAAQVATKAREEAARKKADEDSRAAAAAKAQAEKLVAEQEARGTAARGEARLAAKARSTEDDASAAQLPAAKQPLNRSLEESAGTKTDAERRDGMPKRYVAVVAAKRTIDGARRTNTEMREKYAALKNRDFDIKEVDLTADGKGIHYRSVVGPPGTRADASEICRQLKTEGFTECWISSE